MRVCDVCCVMSIIVDDDDDDNDNDDDFDSWQLQHHTKQDQNTTKQNKTETMFCY